LYLFYISPLIISAVLGLFLGLFIIRNRPAPGSRDLAALIMGASLWSAGYALEFLSPGLESKLFWAKFQYLGIGIIPLTWFVFALQYLDTPGWARRLLRLWPFLAILPGVTIGLVWTNQFHGLVWRQVQVTSTGPVQMLEIQHGPWFWVYWIYSYCLLFLGSVRLVGGLLGTVRLHRWQTRLALLAILIPWLGNLAYITGLNPVSGLDWTPFGFTIAGLLFIISLFRFQLVKILPIAEKRVFAGLPDCLLVLDLQNCIVDLNQSSQKMIGNPGEEPFGKPLEQVVPELAGWVSQAGNRKEFQVEITRGEKPDQRFYELRVITLSGPYSLPVGRLVVCHEITGHKQQQALLEQAVSERTEELRQTLEQLQSELIQRTLAEKRFEDVIESAPDAMLLVDQMGGIMLVNTQTERLFGWFRDELLGKDIIESLVPVQYRDRQRDYLMQFTAHPEVGQTSFGLDLYAQRKDGSEFPVEIDLSYLDTANGYCVAFNVHDISERKRAELALQESQQTYQALFENAGDAIFLLGLKGDIQQVNQKAADLLGYNKEELQALTILDIVVPEEYSDIKQKMDHLSKGDTLAPYARHYRKKTGEALPVEINMVQVNGAGGKPEFFQCIARDITERTKAEQAQNKLMKEIQRSREQLAALAGRLQEIQEIERHQIASELHDRIGQNLTGLNLNLQIIQNQASSKLSPEIRNRLDDSLRLVEETTRQVRDVMTELHPPMLEEYGLASALNWYCANFSRRTGILSRVIGDEFEPRLPPKDEMVLFRLVQEALNNVAKHAQATRVKIRMESSGEANSLIVEDNGLGFNQYGTNEAASQPHWGLLTMRQRATSIGGQLAIDSVPGQGTRVVVSVRRSQNGN
jgi:PAS domain S-box-containing protein